MPRQILKYLAAGCLCIAAAITPSAGQDLLANQAPIDRKLKAVDSVTMQRLIQDEEFISGLSLYTSWNNNTTH